MAWVARVPGCDVPTVLTHMRAHDWHGSVAAAAHRWGEHHRAHAGLAPKVCALTGRAHRDTILGNMLCESQRFVKALAKAGGHATAATVTVSNAAERDQLVASLIAASW